MSIIYLIDLKTSYNILDKKITQIIMLKSSDTEIKKF